MAKKVAPSSDCQTSSYTGAEGAPPVSEVPTGFNPIFALSLIHI